MNRRSYYVPAASETAGGLFNLKICMVTISDAAGIPCTISPLQMPPRAQEMKKDHCSPKNNVFLPPSSRPLGDRKKAILRGTKQIPRSKL
ncbi:hypothetical protein AVEN_2364-1 [Araneus ventricosus]|uniref:Uncharacterized protein n=1 Tax=Araneus ventricosus TaxID=182803 RepID=A0A4Y2V631_ARAVE|nr:hypothetical protein AVEN_2364-1 [Araneus ventricosus]